MNKQELIDIFNDTKNVVESNTEFQKSVSTKYTIGGNFPLNGDKISNIQTINSDTVSVASDFSKRGKTAILNMASYNKPGGGVLNGASAQEECLFRCSNLYKVIPQSFYPLEINECVYTKDAIFFKDKDYGNINPFTVDVITIASINLSKDNSKDILDHYDSITKDKIRFMFDIALQNDCRNIILGAWGCGVFGNNPVDIASMFEEVLMRKRSRLEPSYLGCFDNIIFAVINDNNSVGNNFDVFKNFF